MGAFRHSPGCQCCEQEVDCACFHEILGQVVILELAGVVNRPCCSNCGDFNGTYILPPYPWGVRPVCVLHVVHRDARIRDRDVLAVCPGVQAT
jgi:hypothetical protein